MPCVAVIAKAAYPALTSLCTGIALAVLLVSNAGILVCLKNGGRTPPGTGAVSWTSYTVAAPAGQSYVSSIAVKDLNSDGHLDGEWIISESPNCSSRKIV